MKLKNKKIKSENKYLIILKKTENLIIMVEFGNSFCIYQST